MRTSQADISLDPKHVPKPRWGIPFHQKIRTGEKQISWGSVFILAMMWFTFGFHMFAGTAALSFPVKKYVANPRIIQLVMTMASLILLAPLYSYISDYLWTRAGRRRPFIIVAWLGGFVAMISFAFLPQVGGAINHVLSAIGLAPVGELAILVVIIFCYQKMWDGCTILFTLFLECVPPHQRGRLYAMTGMAFSLAGMFFWQILWPQFDFSIDLLAWLGHPHLLSLTGEQSIYILAAGLFLLTGVFVLFCVEETQMPQAPNKSFRELLLGKKKSPTAAIIQCQTPANGAPLGFMVWLKQLPIMTFIVSFAQDVFLKKENIPYYIILVIPALETTVWGTQGGFMQNDQFGYSKQTQADWAFPLQIATIFIVTPFAGWYSDVRIKVRWWLRILLLAISATAFYAMLYVLNHNMPDEIRQLPDLWQWSGFVVMMGITALGVISMGTLFVTMTETLLDFVGREHTRAWVSLLAIVKSMVITILLYAFIMHSPGHVPPALVWMTFSVVNGVFTGLIATFVGPMIYDYMRRSQMGTINAGNSVMTAFVTFMAANLGAWWVVFYSTHFHMPAGMKYEYSSIYLLMFVVFIPIIIAKVYFVYIVTTGRLKKWGDMEVEDPKEALIEEQAAHVLENS